MFWEFGEHVHTRALSSTPKTAEIEPQALPN